MNNNHITIIDIQDEKIKIRKKLYNSKVFNK
jgi:hypothetical protein